MKLKNNVSLLSASLTALLLTMGTGQALAEDGKVYPASFCKPANSLFAEKLFEVANGEYINNDQSTVVVECPIIKERIESGLRNGFVRFINRNPSSEFRCTIKSRRTHVFPNQGFSITVRTRNARSTVQTLNFGSLGHDRENTTYNMQCQLPGTNNGLPSRIMGYYINENT